MFSEASSPVGELQVSDNTCHVKSVSYSQIVLNSVFFRLDQPMVMCSPKCASPNTDDAYLQFVFLCNVLCVKLFACVSIVWVLCSFFLQCFLVCTTVSCVDFFGCLLVSKPVRQSLHLNTGVVDPFK